MYGSVFLAHGERQKVNWVNVWHSLMQVNYCWISFCTHPVCKMPLNFPAVLPFGVCWKSFGLLKLWVTANVTKTILRTKGTHFLCTVVCFFCTWRVAKGQLSKRLPCTYAGKLLLNFILHSLLRAKCLWIFPPCCRSVSVEKSFGTLKQ